MAWARGHLNQELHVLTGILVRWAGAIKGLSKNREMCHFRLLGMNFTRPSLSTLSAVKNIPLECHQFEALLDLCLRVAIAPPPGVHVVRDVKSGLYFLLRGLKHTVVRASRGEHTAQCMSRSGGLPHVLHKLQ